MIDDYFQLLWKGWDYAQRLEKDQKQFCHGLFEVIYRQFPGMHWRVEIEPSAKKYKRRLPAK